MEDEVYSHPVHGTLLLKRSACKTGYENVVRANHSKYGSVYHAKVRHDPNKKDQCPETNLRHVRVESPILAQIASFTKSRLAC